MTEPAQRKHGRREHDIRTRGQIGKLIAAEARYQDAVRELRGVLSMIDDVQGSEKERANTLAEIANVLLSWYFDQGSADHLDDALEALDQAEVVENAIGYWFGLAKTLANRGRILRHMGAPGNRRLLEDARKSQSRSAWT